MTPAFTANEIQKLILQADSSLKLTDRMEIHFCLHDGVVLFEVKPCGHEVEEIVEAKPNYFGGVDKKRTVRHKKI